MRERVEKIYNLTTVHQSEREGGARNTAANC